MAHDDDETKPLPPPPFAGLHDRVERLHTEHKSWRDQVTQWFHGHDGRIAKLEFLDEQKQERMAEGSKTFAQLRNEISMPWWKILLAIGPGFSALLGLAYSMGRMPSAEEIRDMQKQVQELKVVNAETRETLAGIKQTLDEIKQSRNEIGRKLDDLANKPIRP